MLKKVMFLGHIKEDKKVKPLTSRIDGFEKLEPPRSMKAFQRYLGTFNILAKKCLWHATIITTTVRPIT